jgi:hypothetical protein
VFVLKGLDHLPQSVTAAVVEGEEGEDLVSHLGELIDLTLALLTLQYVTGLLSEEVLLHLAYTDLPQQLS